MRARLLVIQHEDECPPEWLGAWLEVAGVDLAVIHGHRAAPVPETLHGYDGLLVLGGEMGAYDDDRCPWLAPTRRLIARAVADDLPFLGVCLGHQLAAVGLGGSVGQNPHGTAAGLTPVNLTAAGRADRLLGCVVSGDVSVQWNQDIVTAMPSGSVVLAEAPDKTVQAARFGPHAWGVQFHPEVSPEIFAMWTVDGPKADQPRPDGVDIFAAAADVAAARSRLRASWRPLAERFAEIVLASTTSASRSAATR